MAFDFISAMDVFSNGTIMHVYRNAWKHEVDSAARLMIRYSTNGGTVWSTPRVIYDSPFDDRNIAGGITADDTIIIAMQKVTGSGDYVGTGWIRSTDGGATWTFTDFNLGAFGNFRGNLIEIPEQGKIGITGDAGGRLKIAWSTDGGLTFPQRTEIETPVYPNEPSAVYLGNGKVFMIWAHYETGDVYQTTSSDYGETWTQSALTSIIHERSAHGGWIARSGSYLFWLYRYATEGNMAAWAFGNESIVWNDPSAWLSEKFNFCPGDGYGAVAILPNGTALMTYSFDDIDEGCHPYTKDDKDLYYAYAIFDGSTTTPPSVETVAASDIGETQATLTGNLTRLGTADRVNVSFEWGDCFTCLGNATPEQSLTSPATFWGILTGLNPDTVYYFRGKAVGDGTSYGSVLSFATATTPVAPTVATDAATDIGENSARLNGNLADLGTASSVTANFQWGECAWCLGNETPAEGKTETGTYFFDLTGLSSNTTYHFRAKATGNGTSFGETKAFTTASPPPPPPGWTNRAPTIGNPIDTDEGTHNVSYSQRFAASDPDANQTLLWTLDTDASFLGVDGQDRTAWINGTPTFSDTNRWYYVNVTVADQGCSETCNLTDFVNYTLYINNTLPTIINPILSDSGTINRVYSRDFDHRDVNGDAIIWALNSNASFLSVDENGIVSGTSDATGQYYVNATAVDFGSSGDFVNYTLTIGLEWSNTAPTIDNPMTMDEGTHNVTYSHRFYASDTDANQTLIWTLETDATFLNLESLNRTVWINGRPAFAHRDQAFSVRLTVADQGCGGSCSLAASVNFALYINNTQPTIINKISTDSGTVGQPYSRDFDHEDANGDNVVWALDTNASFLNISQDGAVSGTPDVVGTFYVNVAVGNSPAGDFVNYTLTIESIGGGNGESGDSIPTFNVVSSYEILTENAVQFNAEVDPQGQY
ncbi:MAG: sialidase family protein, partial [Bacteroidota bacterium]